MVGRVFDQGRAALVVSTAGAAGCRVHVRGGSSTDVPAAALPGRPAVDSNGAGDAFGSAFLAALAVRCRPRRVRPLVASWLVRGRATPGTNADPIDLPTLRSLLGTEHLAKTPVRLMSAAVIFDWGGTITPWHTIDLRAQWEAFASGMGAIACARNGLAAALYTAEEQAWRRGRTDGSSAWR